MPLGQIRRMGGDFVGDDAGLHIFPVGKAQVFLGRHITEHRAAVPADHGGADAGGDVVVAGRDVGRERAQAYRTALPGIPSAVSPC